MKTAILSQIRGAATRRSPVMVTQAHVQWRNKQIVPHLSVLSTPQYESRCLYIQITLHSFSSSSFSIHGMGLGIQPVKHFLPLHTSWSLYKRGIEQLAQLLLCW